MTDQDTRSVQMESLPQCARCSLLRHLCPSRDLTDHAPFSRSIHPTWFSKQATRLHHGISPGPSRNHTIHEAPAGLQMQWNDQRKTHTLKLLCNIYGQRQARRVWNKFMDQGLSEIGFKPSKFDPCLYYHGPIVSLLYIGDLIFFGPSNQDIEEVVADLHACSRQFMFENRGDVGDFLGIQVQKQEDGSIMLTQPQLIGSIIKYLHLQSSSNGKKTPTLTTSLLHKDTDSPEMTPYFHYRSVIGKFNFLEKSTCPNVSISVHQCTRFSENL